MMSHRQASYLKTCGSDLRAETTRFYLF